MAGRDHTGRIHSSIPLGDTLTSRSDGLRRPDRVACGCSCRRMLTVAIGYS